MKKQKTIHEYIEFEELKRVLMSIFKICIEKGLNFSLNTEVNLISVSDQGISFIKNSYYDGQLFGYENNEGDTVTIPSMLEFVKNYKP